LTTAKHRKYVPVGVRLDACLLALGFTLEQIRRGQIHWDHMPPLGTRAVNDDGVMTPDPNDPRYIQPLLVEEHEIKTWGTPATSAGSDIAAIAKAKRLAADQAAFRATLLARTTGEAPPPEKPKRPWPSRPFPKRRKNEK